MWSGLNYILFGFMRSLFWGWVQSFRGMQRAFANVSFRCDWWKPLDSEILLRNSVACFLFLIPTDVNIAPSAAQ